MSDMLNVVLLKLDKQSNHMKLLLMLTKNNQCVYLTRT